MLHPQVAFRDCQHCQAFLYDEQTGKPNDRRGLPIARPDTIPPPCRTSTGCPKGTPEESRELSAKNWQAYEHYKECRAVGQFPDDPVVRQNARLIADIEHRYEQGRQSRLLDYLEAAFATVKKV